MIKTLTDNQQYRSFLDTRTGDVIVQVWVHRGFDSDIWYEAIVRGCGRVDGGKGHDSHKREAARRLIGADEISIEDADDYLRRLAKRDRKKT